MLLAQDAADRRDTPVWAALRTCRPYLLAVLGFSACANILNLTPTIFTMQVYDRVLPTGHVPTLVTLTLVALACVVALSLFDWLRGRLLIRLGARMDTLLARPVMETLLSRPGLSPVERGEGMRQLDTLRQGLSGPVVTAAVDLPWAPLYILIAFLLHPLLGALALAGCLLLLAIAWGNERAVHGRTSRSEAAAATAHATHAHATAHASEVRAMGMQEALTNRLLGQRAIAKDHQLAATFAASGHSNLVRFSRLVLQSVATALGAWLAVAGAISPGAVIAAGFLFARAMAPIDQVVAGWRGLVAARNSWGRLDRLLQASPPRERMELPAPTGRLSVERLTVLAPGTDRVALADVSFAVAPGEQIGVVGLSGAGKSTLLRTLGGALDPVRGSVRYDDVAHDDWMPAQISRAIGYLPQDFVLFPGTVKENIARFDADLGADATTLDQRVVAAAQAAGVHEMIARLPDGYATPIGLGGAGLSAGQRQRIALARALYGDPRILILDEPNAHLDGEARYRLVQLLSGLRARGTTVVMAAHSGEVLASMDKLLHLDAGRVAAFGPIKPGPNTPSSVKIAKDA